MPDHRVDMLKDRQLSFNVVTSHQLTILPGSLIKTCCKITNQRCQVTDSTMPSHRLRERSHRASNKATPPGRATCQVTIGPCPVSPEWQTPDFDCLAVCANDCHRSCRSSSDCWCISMRHHLHHTGDCAAAWTRLPRKAHTLKLICKRHMRRHRPSHPGGHSKHTGQQ